MSRGYKGDHGGHIGQDQADVFPREGPAARDCEAYGPVPKHGEQLAAADRCRRAEVSEARQSKRRR
ncbi:hypothetical protein B7G54_35770, partial [Burkholderia puraquae]